MDHTEAVATEATERYLLGELAPEVRDQFEEHLFDCQVCALDLRAAATFIEQSKIVLGSQETARENSKASGLQGWMRWFRPAFAVPVMAALLAVIGYQTLMGPRGSAANAPRLVSSLLLTSGASRGTSGPSTSLERGEPLLLSVDVPAQEHAASYKAELHNPDGSIAWSLALPADAIKDTIHLQVPSLRSGVYTLTVLDSTPDRAPSKVAEYSFEVRSR